MTPDELNDALDKMQAAAGDDADKAPGLIEIQVDDWINRLAAMPTGRPQTIVDGVRIRDIKVAIGSDHTKVLSRKAAGERGEPYRDLAP
ncbi:hypothetical protein GCM10017620_24410 [Brevundimonas intermedia]|uniref:Uncharacterized protein n=1 Tax=Brevundimonas intermedia TaxID=74315 RepID=A0ABQ5TDX3_9CAUL|nr:hypothetical protein [Brevundimonas intermedia]GLK49468.1 hypothetical protein GCM10017620_24410 [Brevundimonas intermedia]